MVDPIPTPFTAATCFKAGASGLPSSISIRPRLQNHRLTLNP
jgi:hypothetical protein